MELQPFIDNVRHEMNVAAAAGGDDAVALAERLTAPLESAIRLALLEALSAAAEEITRELAPRSVEVRLRGREPEFTVTPDVDDALDDELLPIPDSDADGGTWRVTLRLPEHLRAGVDASAQDAGVSVNAWLVRAVTAALSGNRRPRQRPGGDKHLSGWVR